MPLTCPSPHRDAEDREHAAGPAEVRAYLDDLIVRQPELFERMALSEIRKLRPRLRDDEALSIAYDASLAVVRMAEHIPVRLGTVLGLVRAHVRWTALDRVRQLRTRHEVAAGIGRAGGDDELAGLIARAQSDSLTEDTRAAAQLRLLDRIAARLRGRLDSAARDGRLRLSEEQLGALREGPHGAGTVARKRMERAHAAIARWARDEVTDDGERRLLALLLGDQRPHRQRRGREPELVRVLGLDRAMLHRGS